MRHVRRLLCLTVVFTAGSAQAQEGWSALQREVAASERAFARSMTDRDHGAFMTHVAEDAVFFGGPGVVLTGRQAVADGWRRFFDGAQAPFSWEPKEVEVLASGTLALSSGPVYGPDGSNIGTFNSVWRLESDGKWRVVFDKGCPPCPGG
ncbi:MAG TPA: nuclear transport factor 2 family protein [Gemmatimonadales bacterium]|jgi:ketosteroid isomerase-like protein